MALTVRSSGETGHVADHAIIANKLNGYVDPIADHDAAGDGVTDDTDEVQAALAAACTSGLPLYLPSLFLTSAPLVPSAPVRVVGAGRLAGGIVNATSDVFELGVRNCTFEHLTVHSRTGGGHCFKQTAAVTHTLWDDVYVEQDNAAKSVYSHIADAGNHLFNSWRRFKIVHVRTATVPTFHFLVSTSDGATNANVWQDGEINSTGAYGFHFESARAGNYVYDMTLRDIYWEVPSGGCVKLLGAVGAVLDGHRVYDLNVESAHVDLFVLGEGTNVSDPAPSRHNTLRGLSLNGQDTQFDEGVQFVRLVAGEVNDTMISSLRQNSTGTVPVHYGDTSVIEVGCKITRVGGASTTVLA